MAGTHTVTEADREHFRLLGEWKRRGHDEARRENLARPAGERLEVSIAVGIACADMDRWGRRSDIPLARYRRARRLGLARS